MDPAHQTENFSRNLRLLCEQSGSISNICKKIKINRQQFNKYLSGKHSPSASNIRIIANHFNIAPDVLFLESEKFQELVDGNFFHVLSELHNLPHFASFIQSAALEADSNTDNLLGVYDRYQFSSIYPKKILRSTFCIFKKEDFLCHCYVERFPSYDDPSKVDYVFKYHGFVLPTEGRIFTIDFERILKNEMTFGIYSKVQRSSQRFLFGISSGIAATMFRQPYSTRVALQYRRPGLIERDELEKVGTLEASDPSIPREALQYLGDGTDMVKPD